MALISQIITGIKRYLNPINKSPVVMIGLFSFLSTRFFSFVGEVIIPNFAARFKKKVNNSYGHIASQPIHFSQWSNTSYAIFNSIGRIVHIGFLSSIIHGLITVKALISHGFLTCRQAGLMLFELIDEDALLLNDPIDLLNIDELIACEYCNLSIPFSNTVSRDINYINYNLLERPFLGLFSFVGFILFMRNQAFFILKKSIK